MADDMFGDSSLFEEFDKEREPSGSFIIYEKDNDGETDQSKYVFQVSDSSSSDESDSDEEKVQGKSVGHSVQLLQKQSDSRIQIVNGDSRSSEGESESEEEELTEDSRNVVNKSRLDKAASFKLNFERNKFKRYCNIIDSTRFIHDEETPAVQVLFQNNKISRKYKTEIESFFQDLLNREACSPAETMMKLDLKSSAASCTELNNQIPVERRTDKMFHSHCIIGCSQFYHKFIMDTLGWPLVEYNPSLTDSWDIPAYEQAFTDVLPLDAVTIKTIMKKKEREKSKSRCWNCGGDHMLAACPDPKDQQKINENRKLFMDKSQSSSGPKSQRYHVESDAESKFKPGVISPALREALGLQSHQLPLYIYKMRALGYPPGWMEDAKSGPGLAMFDKDGKDPEDSMDEGEVSAAPALDVKKVIEYPGFTVETPEEFVDECEYYGLPALQPHQLKATLLADTQRLEESLKRDHEEEEEEEGEVTDIKRMRLNTSDMDLDDSMAASNISYHPPLPPDTPPCQPPVPLSTPPPTPDETSRQSAPSLRVSRESSLARSESEGRRSASPSLEELERQYQQLQKTLQQGNDDSLIMEDDLVVVDVAEEDSSSGAGEQSSNPIVLDADTDSSDEKITNVDMGNTSTNPIEIANDSIDSTLDDFEFTKPKLMKSESMTSIKTFGELGTGSPSSSAPGTPVHNTSIEYKPEFKGTLSKSKDFSTPIMKRAASIEALPTDSKFAQGIEDHIPFENLPNATGNFEKMRKLIGKIQKLKPSFKKKK